jgi:predicted ArsR family transcriptional regulator
MEPADIRAYQRQLILFCLGIHGESTAAEALELMGNAALEAGAPREAMLLSTAAAAGLLRELDGEGLVRRCENRDSGRNGRPMATWAATDAGRIERAPLPPSGQQQLAMPMLAPVPGQRTRGGLSMEQLMGLLNVEFDCMLEQMDREHQAAQQRARQEFEAFRQRAMRVWGASEASV